MLPRTTGCRVGWVWKGSPKLGAQSGRAGLTWGAEAAMDPAAQPGVGGWGGGSGRASAAWDGLG